MCSQSRKKSDFESDMDEESTENDKRSAKSKLARESKPIRHINPLGYRVVVRIVKENNMTDAGLYLPDGAKQNMQESVLAEVVEVASAVDDETHEEANVSGIPHGALVLIPKELGIRVPWDEDLRIIETKNILAIIEEVRLT